MDLVQRLEAVGREGLPDRALRTRQLELVAARVPFDAHLFALTDPATGVVTSPHAALPMVGPDGIPDLVRRRYTAGDDEEWRRTLAGIGVRDTLSVRLHDRWGVWGFLDLWRCAVPFGERERGRLAGVAEPLTTAVRESVARTFSASAGPAPGLDSGVVLLAADLRLHSVTSGAAEALLRFLPPAEQAPPLPAAAYNVGAALLAHERGIRRWEPWSRVHLGADRWATLHAERLGEQIAVSIGPSGPAHRADLFARANRLSERQTEVLRLVLRGLDTRAVAEHLVIARTTAEDHVKALLARTGTVSRQQLLARVLGS